VKQKFLPVHSTEPGRERGGGREGCMLRGPSGEEKRTRAQNKWEFLKINSEGRGVTVGGTIR